MKDEIEGCEYENNALKCYGQVKKNYGEVFREGDVIRACIDLE